jgi:hypothetical protein
MCHFKNFDFIKCLNSSKAKNLLKKKKFYETNLIRTENQLDNLGIYFKLSIELNLKEVLSYFIL